MHAPQGLFWLAVIQCIVMGGFGGMAVLAPRVRVFPESMLPQLRIIQVGALTLAAFGLLFAAALM